MRAETELRAFEALSLHQRIGDFATLAHEAMQAALATRSADGSAKEGARAEALARRAETIRLAHDEAVTPFGNVLDVIARRPQTDDERALARALAAHAVASRPPTGRDAEDRTATELLWLALHTPFDATGLLDRALPDGASSMWDAFADRLRRIDNGSPPALERSEAFLAAIALASSRSPAAAKLASALAAELRDDKIAYILSLGASGDDDRLVGEIVARPRGSVATALLGLTGVSLVLHLFRLVGRVAFAYRTPAEIALLGDGGVRVRWRVELLGRTLRDRDLVVPRHGLADATREVRYPSAALYAALVALVVGTYVGVSAFADGLRAASPSLLVTGIALIALGL
ncbi:MAG: hypothetical protein FWD17_16885, partial [Polyangiaceae bacterium]|nr:hypothetical protein [Polyangiaceae bacterium]